MNDAPQEKSSRHSLEKGPAPERGPERDTARGPASEAEVRVSDNVQDYTADRERLRLVRQAAQFLAETLTRAS